VLRPRPVAALAIGLRANCGVTQNMSEGFNTVMRRIQEWKEAPIDVCMLTLYQLQCFYGNNIRLGCSNRGDYRLACGRRFHRDEDRWYALFAFTSDRNSQQMIGSIRVRYASTSSEGQLTKNSLSKFMSLH